MKNLLKVATADNSLRAAFKSLQKSEKIAPSSERAVEAYQKYFVSTGQVVHAQTARFERFSLTDPSIQTVLSASTESAR